MVIFEDGALTIKCHRILCFSKQLFMSGFNWGRRSFKYTAISRKVVGKMCTRQSPVRATTRSGYMMTSPTFAKWRPRRETRGKVTSWLFAAPRSVLSPYYFESCDFRQWEIRGVKKKCRPMNVCAFLGGKTTEHESFSAQRNARQGAKHRKKEGECHFLDLWKKFFWNLHKICLLIVVCLV